MATYYNEITPEQGELILQSPLFFVASTASDNSPGPNGEGSVNVSPKAGVPLHMIDSNRVMYLDYSGSGNETARHADSGGPTTLMVCSFSTDDAAIVRLFGKATIRSLDDAGVQDSVTAQGSDEIALPARQVVDITVERTVTSCGYGVPIMHYVTERTTSNRGRNYKQGKSSSRQAGQRN